jgi:hypothetical protein
VIAVVSARDLLRPVAHRHWVTLAYRFTNLRVPRAVEQSQASAEKDVAEYKIRLEGTGPPRRP